MQEKNQGHIVLHQFVYLQVIFVFLEQLYEVVEVRVDSTGNETKFPSQRLLEVQATSPHGSCSIKLHFPLFYHRGFLQSWNESSCVCNLSSYRCWNSNVPFRLFPWKVHLNIYVNSGFANFRMLNLPIFIFFPPLMQKNKAKADISSFLGDICSVPRRVRTSKNYEICA